MKKSTLLCFLLLSSSAVFAEEMKFVTLLSQPVGSFAKVELLDESKPAKIYHLNFCNKDAISGTINVAADCLSDEENCYPVDIEKLVVDSGNNATLSSTGGNAVKYYKAASSITIWSQANFTGGTLDVRAGNGNGGTGQADPNKVLVSTGSDGGSAAFRTDKIVANVASFNLMALDDGTDKAFLNAPASGDALCASGLGWKQVASTNSSEKDADVKAYLLYGCETAVTTPSTCSPACSSGYKCVNGKCVVSDDCRFTLFCASPKQPNYDTCTCECPMIACIPEKVFNKETCKCENPITFDPVDKCANMFCPNGNVAIQPDGTCKCIPYAVIP